MENNRILETCNYLNNNVKEDKDLIVNLLGIDINSLKIVLKSYEKFTDKNEIILLYNIYNNNMVVTEVLKITKDLKYTFKSIKINYE